MIQTIRQGNPLEQLHRTCSRLARGPAGDPKRQRDVVSRVQFVKQMMMLKNEAQKTVSETRPARPVEIGYVLSAEFDRARIGSIEQPEQMEQRTLADSGRTDDCQHLAPDNLEIEIPQDLDPRLALAVTLGEPSQTNHHGGVTHTATPRPVPAGRPLSTAATTRPPTVPGPERQPGSPSRGRP